jgi:hypothetical protein
VFFFEIFDFDYEVKMVVKQRNCLLKTSDSKHNLMEKWGNMEKAN